MRKKNADINKIKESWYEKEYFLKLHLCVYLHTKFQVTCIILTRFRQRVVLLPPPQKELLKSLINVKMGADFITRIMVIQKIKIRNF